MNIWHKQVPLKALLLVCRLFHNRLPTRDNLPPNNLCVGGCDLEEITAHVFLHCLHFGCIWSLIQ